ncbi:MAG: class I SAM-dependent methyltransferase [Acidobacteriota bacterium]
MDEPLDRLLSKALAARADLFDTKHEVAFRLFNGFTEGWPDLAVDVYGTTLLLHDYSVQPGEGVADDPAAGEAEGPDPMTVVHEFYRARLPWIDAVLLKTHQSQTSEARNGRVLLGTTLTRKVREPGAPVPAWYSIDLTLNRDASLYLDTRCLRNWAMRNLGGKRVLNTFAYTGSLGVAARAGGAARVTHVDLNREFLNVAKTSYTLNGFPIDKRDFQGADFWPQISLMIRAGDLFDCVLLDPPIFAATRKGVVDAAKNYARVVNKVRPLIADGGCLVAVNNGVFASGVEYLEVLKSLGAGGYLTVDELIPVDEDFAGYEATRVPGSGADPAPFNHSTKIAVIRVRRKDAMGSNPGEHDRVTDGA